MGRFDTWQNDFLKILYCIVIYSSMSEHVARIMVSN